MSSSSNSLNSLNAINLKIYNTNYKLMQEIFRRYHRPGASAQNAINIYNLLQDVKTFYLKNESKYTELFN